MTRRRKRRGACLAAAALAVGLVVSLASQGASGALPPAGPAKVVVSKPKPDAIAEAIAAVEPGGKVRIRKGRYRESLLIEKPVHLVGAGKGRPTIDGLCQFPSTVTIHSGGVTLKGLKVQGAGSFAAVDFSGVPDGRADDLHVRNTCDAEYGINVFATGAVHVTDNRASGFTDAGIYVGDITSTPNGTLRVGDNRTFGNNKGVIVEFSAGGDIAVFSNEIHDNNIPGVGEQVGLFVFDSDGVRIQSNRIRNNGQAGLVLTPNSDNNSITGNEIAGNPVDVRNEGLGNCGSGNTFATGGPLSPC
jgi:parallel beta-helix repeat protein